MLLRQQFLKRIFSSTTHSLTTQSLTTQAAQQEATKNVSCYVDGKQVTVPNGSVIIQACQAAGIDVPRFCYHERLAIAGNCRMCLVSVEKMPKLVASCAFPVSPDMRITTNSPAVHKAREGVMEFLLANHPLDCVICDQGGECDLQDQSMQFGSDRSRWTSTMDGKRAVEDKHFGPLVKTSMNRCIHCTRCVRFGNDIAGMTELGTSGRGHHMEIRTYINKLLDNPLSGNIIDLCPVGALTSKPYAFTARPWELKRTESVDVMDAVGSAVRIDSRGPRVMRVLPRLHEAVNEEWLADKSRFACDGLSNQRLLNPMIKRNNSKQDAKQDGSWEKVQWIEALALVASRMNSAKSLAIVAGDFTDAETLACAKRLKKVMSLNTTLLNNETKASLNDKERTLLLIDEWIGMDEWMGEEKAYLRGGFRGVEERDAIVLLGTDPMKEAPLLATRIRKAWLRGARIFYAGKPPKFLPFEPEYLDSSTNVTQVLAGFKNPLVLYGDWHLNKLGRVTNAGIDSAQVLRQAGRAAALELGYTQKHSACEVYILLGADTNITHIPSEAFVAYIGHHGDAGAERADVILPGCSYVEKSGTYVNLEGRVQRTRMAVPPPGEARPDWQILSALGEVAGLKDVMIQDELEMLKELSHYGLHRPNTLLPTKQISGKDTLLPTKQVSGKDTLLPAKQVLGKEVKGLVGGYAETESVVRDYYLTDVISRASPTMAKCSEAFNNQN